MLYGVNTVFLQPWYSFFFSLLGRDFLQHSPPVEIQNHTDVLALPFTLWCQRATDRAGEDVEWRTSQRLSNLQFVA